MRLNRQYIRTQLMVQNMLKEHAFKTSKTRSSHTAAVFEKSSAEGLKRLNYSKDRIVNNAGSFSRLYQTANNRTVADTGEETVIRANNPYESQSDICTKILDEKYSRINAINKTKPDPLGYIKDKYKNPASPYFRSDLTAARRQGRI